MSDEAAAVTVKTTPPRGERKCSQEGCKRPYKAKRLCNVHYRKMRHGELPGGHYKTCTKEGCLKRRAVAPSGSMCAEHSATGEATPA